MLSEASLGINKRMQQCLIAARQSNHSLVYRHIAVRIEPHRLTDNIRAFGSGTREKSHLIHGIKQLSVGRLEAVYRRDSAGYYARHDVRHVVFLNGFGYRLKRDLRSFLRLVHHLLFL